MLHQDGRSCFGRVLRESSGLFSRRWLACPVLAFLGFFPFDRTSVLGLCRLPEVPPGKLDSGRDTGSGELAREKWPAGRVPWVNFRRDYREYTRGTLVRASYTAGAWAPSWGAPSEEHFYQHNAWGHTTISGSNNKWTAYRGAPPGGPSDGSLIQQLVINGEVPSPPHNVVFLRVVLCSKHGRGSRRHDKTNSEQDSSRDGTQEAVTRTRPRSTREPLANMRHHGIGTARKHRSKDAQRAEPIETRREKDTPEER